MNYERFLECMKANFEERGYIASIQQATKTQGRSYLGLYVREEEQTVGITADLREQYRAYTRGELKLEEIFSRFLAEAQEKLADVPHVTAEMIRIRKENLLYQLINLSWSQDMIHKIPYKQIRGTNLAVVSRVEVEDFPEGTVMVTHDLLAKEGITQDELFGSMLEDVAKIRPASFINMSDILGCGMDGAQMYVAAAGNKNNFYGSGCIAYPGFLDSVYADFREGFYILPSSVHEVILMRDSDVVLTTPGELIDIVKHVNQELDPGDVLSDNIYHYDTDRGFIMYDGKEKRAAGTAPIAKSAF